jgi:hypothetical protein
MEKIVRLLCQLFFFGLLLFIVANQAQKAFKKSYETRVLEYRHSQAVTIGEGI